MFVDVYFNLKKLCFSVRHRGKVVAYGDNILLQNVVFKVSEKGRQRVLREKRKNVHAYARGILIDYRPFSEKDKELNAPWGNSFSHKKEELVTYNPYKYSQFVRAEDETPIFSADMIRMVAKDGRGSIMLVN